MDSVGPVLFSALEQGSRLLPHAASDRIFVARSPELCKIAHMHNVADSAKTRRESCSPHRIGERRACEAGGLLRSELRAPRKHDHSCRKIFRRELCTRISPLYSMNPSFLKRFMKKLTRERVVPIISANTS